MKKILFKSISNSKLQGYPLYKPYRIVKDGNELDIIFRDHNLSDAIGFVVFKMGFKCGIRAFYF